MSGGAALVAARQIAATLDEGFIVVIIPDSGERYLSDPMIGEEDNDAAARWRWWTSARKRVTSSINTRSKPIRTNAAARCSATPPAAASSRRSRFRTPPKKARAAGSWCVPPTISRRNAAPRRAGLELIGFYHSHPDHPARPSQHDLDHAWPNFHYVIASVLQGRVDDVRTWFLRDDRSQFDERPLINS